MKWLRGAWHRARKTWAQSSTPVKLLLAGGVALALVGGLGFLAAATLANAGWVGLILLVITGGGIFAGLAGYGLGGGAAALAAGTVLRLIQGPRGRLVAVSASALVAGAVIVTPLLGAGASPADVRAARASTAAAVQDTRLGGAGYAVTERAEGVEVRRTDGRPLSADEVTRALEVDGFVVREGSAPGGSRTAWGLGSVGRERLALNEAPPPAPARTAGLVAALDGQPDPR